MKSSFLSKIFQFPQKRINILEDAQVPMKTDDTLKTRFLKQYGGLDFDNVKYRPGQLFTTGFGFDSTFGAFRIHNAIDRGNKGPAPANPIYAPFDCFIAWEPEASGGFGSMLTLTVDYGFEVRIAHMDELDPAIYNKLNGHIKAGTLLGQAGNKGVGTGVHTHTEIISAKETSEMLNEIMFEKYGQAIHKYYTEDDAVDYIRTHRLKNSIDNPQEAYRQEVLKRKIKNLNQYVCIRNDYRDGKLKTFYNSQLLFGM